MTWRWLDASALLAAHDEQLAEHGGPAGIRDLTLCESALARSRNLAAYGKPNVFDLAAAYGVGLIRNHAFTDGNKRIAAIATETFLLLNGYRLVVTDADYVITFLRLAASELDETDFSDWLGRNAVPL